MLKRASIGEVKKDRGFVDCYFSCDVGEASYMLTSAGFFHIDVRKLGDYDSSAHDLYRKLNKGSVRFEGPRDSRADCMNITLEEDMWLRKIFKAPQRAFQSKVRCYFENNNLLASLLVDSLFHGHDVAYVNPSTKKAFSYAGGFPTIR